MNGSAPSSAWKEVAAWAARWILGGVFIYLGLSKAFHPVEFLKVLREYGIFSHPLPLTFVAATLPWFEVLCGLLLVLGVAVRGTATLLILMLIPFSLLILNRALAIGDLQNIALCAVRFDCGCGTGVVAVCPKLIENGFLVLLSIWLVFTPACRGCLRHSLVRTPD